MSLAGSDPSLRVAEYYGRLAPDYHLLFDDWTDSLREQGEWLDRIIRKQLGPGPHAVLDCACGIGTQAIGLALAGHHVTATDLSPEPVERAKQEAARFGVSIAFGTADFRELDRGVEGVFDAVVCCDNALPHVTTQVDLHRATTSMASRLRAGGLVVISTRNYDALRESRPRATRPVVYGATGNRRVVLQVWDWEESDKYSYTVMFIQESGDGWILKTHSGGRYWALSEADLAEALNRAGFESIEWLPTSVDEFRERTIIARKSGELT